MLLLVCRRTQNIDQEKHKLNKFTSEYQINYADIVSHRLLAACFSLKIRLVLTCGERRLHSIAVAYRTFRKDSFDRTFFLVGLLQNFDHLFKVNEKKAGGSFYLQSKVSMCIQ